MNTVQGHGVALHRLIEVQASEAPGSIALDGTPGRVTYAQLNRRANQIASSLHACGVAKGSIVVTASGRTPDTVAALLAIMKCGAAYCPIDASLPAARIEVLLQETNPTVVIRHRAGPAVPHIGRATQLSLDDIGPSDDAHPNPVDVGMNDAACIMYTSGSTGRPKGAIIPHRGIHRLLVESHFVPFGPHLRTLSHSPLHFDASTFELWASLIHGGTCVLFSGGAVPSLQELRTTIREYQVNCLFLGPAMFNLIVDEEIDLLAGLDDVIVGGEAMSVAHTRKAVARHPATRYTNGYGPTETTTFATTYLIPRDLPSDTKTIPIGKPIARTACHLFTESGTLAPEGAAGELFIGGAGVALGYLGRPDLTSERFVPEGLSDHPEAMLYRTGDLCRCLPDGNLEFIGRVDRQLKIHGHRIEPAEIESTLELHPAVAQSVVVLREADSDRHLAAYIVAHRGMACEPGALQTFLAERLPYYMVPRWIVPLDHLPITPNGKVDREALPMPPSDSRAHGGLPETDLQSRLLTLWQQVLSNDQAGVDDGFFEMGGTSLGAMRLCSLIERATGHFVTVAMLADHSSVRRMEGLLLDSSHHRAPTGLTVYSRQASCGVPLFCLPGVGGHVLNLVPLAQLLSERRPVYCFQAPGLDGRTVPAETIVAMATQFIAEIRRHHSTGPVHLLGFSFGGAVAWEMAQQLIQSATPARSVVLLDAFTPEARRYKPLSARALVHLQQVFRYGPGFLLKKARWRLQRAAARRGSLVATGQYDELSSRVTDMNHKAHDNYQPAPYAGNVICLLSADDQRFHEFREAQGRRGWEHLATGSLQTHLLAGGHSSMLQPPHLSVLAETINRCLSELDR